MTPNPQQPEPSAPPSPTEATVHVPGLMYAERDIESQDEYYTRHLEAMTAERLHDKSAIAAELAHRDIKHDQLQYEFDHLKVQLAAVKRERDGLAQERKEFAGILSCERKESQALRAQLAELKNHAEGDGASELAGKVKEIEQLLWAFNNHHVQGCRDTARERLADLLISLAPAILAALSNDKRLDRLREVLSPLVEECKSALGHRGEWTFRLGMLEVHRKLAEEIVSLLSPTPSDERGEKRIKAPPPPQPLPPDVQAAMDRRPKPYA
jgi:hypothetical protein